MNDKYEVIKKIAKENNGFVRTSQIEEAGIYRSAIKEFVDQDLLVCERKGIYSIKEEFDDEYVLLQMQSSKFVYSYGTALFLHGLSDRTPHIIDITVPQGTKTTRYTRDNENLRFHYVKKEIYELGICEITTPQGGTVKVYDKERCICDIVKKKEKMDKQLYIRAIQDYFHHKPNNRKILKYAKELKIDKDIKTYIDILTPQ